MKRILQIIIVLLAQFGYSQTNTWTGATSTAWAVATNWSLGTVPLTAQDVVVPNVTNKPSITVAGAVCKSLTIDPSAELTVSQALTVSTTTVIFGTLTIGNATGTKLFTGGVTVAAGGTWNNSANSPVTFRGGITNNGVFTAGTGLQTFDTAAQSLFGTIALPSVVVTGIVLTNNATCTINTALSGTGTLLNSATGTLVLGGTCSVTTFNNAGTTTITGAGTISTALLNFINTKTLNLQGTGNITGITNNAGGVVNLASSGTIESFNNATTNSTLFISAAPVPPITTLNAGTSGNNIFYTALADQIVKATTYSFLSLGGSGIKTISTTTRVDRVLSMDGTATASGPPTYGGTALLRYFSAAPRTAGPEWITPFNATGGITIAGTQAIIMGAPKVMGNNAPIIINNGATLNTGATANSLSLGGNFIRGSAANFNAGGSPIIISGTANQNIAGFTTVGNVQFTKTGGTATFVGNVNGATLFLNATNNSGTLNLGALWTHTFTGNLRRLRGILNGGSSLLRIGNALTVEPAPTSTFIASTGTIEYFSGVSNNFYGSDMTYYNLILSGSGTKVLSTVTTISNNLIIRFGTKVDLNTFTHPVGKLTLASAIAPVGTHGGTGSAATYKSADFFGTVFTGTINVSSIACSAYTALVDSGDSVCNSIATPVNIVVNLIGGVGPFTVVYRNDISNAQTTVTNYTSGAVITLSPIPIITTPYTLISVTDPNGCTALIAAAHTSVLFYSIPNDPTAAVVDKNCTTPDKGSITINNALSSSSLKFNGVNTDRNSTTPIDSHVDFGIPLLSNRAQFTAEGWIKFDKTKYVNRMSIFGQNDVLEFGFQNEQVECWTFGGGSTTLPLSSYPSDNAWHHIAVIANGQNLQFYVDGVLRSSGGSPTTNYGSSTFTTKIGWGVMDAGGVGLVGEVFNLGFWSRALSVQELVGLASGFVDYNAKQVGLLAGYGFNEGTGTFVNAVGSPAPQGVLKGATLPVWTDPNDYNWTSIPAGFTSKDRNLTLLNPGTYNLNVSRKGCFKTGSWIVGDGTKTWNGSVSTDVTVAENWSPNGVPTSIQCVTIPLVTNQPGLVGTNKVLAASTLQIDSGSTLIVNPSNTLYVEGSINVVPGGKLVFENTASLLQGNTTSDFDNSGLIVYKRISAPMKNFDYTYWSSPVIGQTTVGLSPNTFPDKYFSFNGATASWVLDKGLMIPGKGYIIRVPKPGVYTTYPETVTEPYPQPVAFNGEITGGSYFNTVGPNQDNLLGNPYPSALDADLFMTNANNAAMISGGLYFWTHNTPIQQSGTKYIYTSSDYATYTLTGGVGTGVGSIVGSNPAPGRYIGAGQAFFVSNVAGGTYEFQNTMRVPFNNTQFFKQANTKKATTEDKSRIWLNLTNSEGAFKQLLVGYVAGATNDWDNLYDAPSFDGQPYVDFYSINQGKNLTVQGRGVPFEETDRVPLGYRSTIAGPFEIGIDSRDGTLSSKQIWLEDTKTGIVHDLTKANYTFTAIKGIENNRFIVTYTNKTLGTNDNELADKSLIVSVKNKKITLTSSAEAITQVQIFDLLGRKVYDKSKINVQEWSIATLSLSEQTLIVKTTLANGATSSKKIIY